MEREPLDWWLDWINVFIDIMADTYLGGSVQLDYSEVSLQELEQEARKRYRYPVEVLGDDHFVAGWWPMWARR